MALPQLDPSPLAQPQQPLQAYDIDVNGRQWNYFASHKSLDDTRPTILMLHGFTLGSSLLTYGPLASSLASNYQVIVPDLPGFGKSDELVDADGNPIHDSDAYARALAGFMDALGITKCHIIAFSMGGAITLRYVCDNLDKVSSLLLVSSYGLRQVPFPGIFLQLGLQGHVAEALVNPLLSSKRLLRVLMRQVVLSGKVDASLFDEVAATELSLPAAFMGWLRSEVGWFAHRHHDAPILADLICPVQLVHGTRDLVVPVMDSQRAAARYHLPLTQLKGYGHWLPRQAPEVLEQHIHTLIELS
ncbi:MAG: alpha/beta hydrolase [Deinococcota bacterium]